MTNNDELKRIVLEMQLHENGGDVLENDTEIIEYVLQNCSFIIPKENRFFASMYCDPMIWVFWKRAEKYSKNVDQAGLRDGENALAHTGILDFSHTNPEWQTILSLGIAGLRNRAQICASAEEDPSKKRFYSCVQRVYEAAIGFIKRVADQARALGRDEMADGLDAMTQRAPSSLYEAMQTTIVYYMLQHMTECTYVRTLGRLDGLYYPFFANEDKKSAETLLHDFYKEIDTLRAPSNIPFAIGGINDDGLTLVNELSYMLLKTYRKAETNNTKFHILISETTPADLIKEALCAVREGNNSIVFMSDTKITESLIKHGADPFDARRYHVVGCHVCTEICPTEALVPYGKGYTPLELAQALMEDEPFFRNGRGGVTLSGGECLSQPQLAIETARILKENGVSVFVDTCGYVKREILDAIMPYTDKFLYDLKAFSEDTHIRCTGRSNQLILENLKYLSDTGARIEVWIPFVPELNGGEMKDIAKFISKLNIEKVKVLPYHNYAVSRYGALGLEAKMPGNMPSEEQTESIRSLIRSYCTGIEVV